MPPSSEAYQDSVDSAPVTMSAYTIKKETNIGEADTEKIPQTPVMLDSNMPTTKETMAAATHSMQFVLDNKISFTTVPEITTSEESPNYVLINLQEIQNMVIFNYINYSLVLLPVSAMLRHCLQWF